MLHLGTGHVFELGGLLGFFPARARLDSHAGQRCHFVPLLVEGLLVHHKYRFDAENDCRRARGRQTILVSAAEHVVVGGALALCWLVLGAGKLLRHGKFARWLSRA